MLEINYTCSFGPTCHSSTLLKRNKYKLCSYPFDWIFSSPDVIINCIEDNFNIFLDKSYYQDINDKWNNNQCGHKYYHVNMFNHFDPRNEKDYNYYIRCVDRFKNLLKKQEHKLFIMTFTKNSNIENNCSKNEIIKFNNNLKKYTSNYTLLVIFHIPNKQQTNHIFTYNDNIHFLELHTTSSDNLSLGPTADNIYLDNIINSNYNFNLNISSK